MKSLIRGIFIFSALLLTTVGCAARERYVGVAEDVQTKAAMVNVYAIAEVTVLRFGENGLEMHTSTRPVRYAGSAVFISKTGTLLTCAHLFDNPNISTITVTSRDGITQTAALLSADFGRDLALIKVDGFHQDAAKLSKERLRVGQEVIAVGNPLGLDFTTTHGIVSTLNRDLDTGFYFTQIDAPINGGNSGGPLFNLSGELIGINAAKMQDADGLGFAIAPEVIDDFLNQFRGI